MGEATALPAEVTVTPRAVPAPRVCIAIPTYRRPELLKNLLLGIAALTPPQGTRVDVLVMDNDPAQSAQTVAAGLHEHFPFPLAYAHVVQPGLSSVRNFALERARQGYDFLAMIDDDEVPQPQWLIELLRVQDATQADGVVGPVPRSVPSDASSWLRDGKFFELPVYPDGSFVKDGYSGNCLLRVRSIERLGITFDPALNLAGGEDLMFFREFRGGGAKLVFAANAVAEESVGPERATAAYILKLNYRRGNTLSLCDRRLDGSAKTLAARALKACARIVRGCATAVPYAVLRGRTGGLIAVCDVAHGFGSIAGLIGHTYQAYDRPDGASSG